MSVNLVVHTEGYPSTVETSSRLCMLGTKNVNKLLVTDEVIVLLK